jgi:hypothetical protein
MCDTLSGGDGGGILRPCAHDTDVGVEVRKDGGGSGMVGSQTGRGSRRQIRPLPSIWVRLLAAAASTTSQQRRQKAA